jgi:uncharacterized membrane protein YqgA involved in biofilm formation
MIGLGTIVNAAAVVAGGLLGILFKGGLKQRFQDILMHALGLSVIFIGIAGALKGIFVVNGPELDTKGTLLMVAALVIGALLGELINIEKHLDRFGEFLKRKFTKDKNDTFFVDAFVTTSLVVCVGAMGIVGSLQDGLSGDATTLYTKALLDLIIVMVYASAKGKGTIFAAIPLLIYQGAITAFARVIQPLLTDQVIADISFVGAILIFCVGVNLMFKTKIKVGNMIPALVIVVVYDLLVSLI